MPAALCRSPGKPGELDCEGVCMLVMPLPDVFEIIQNINDNKSVTVLFAIIVGNYELHTDR